MGGDHTHYALSTGCTILAYMRSLGQLWRRDGILSPDSAQILKAFMAAELVRLPVLRDCSLSATESTPFQRWSKQRSGQGD